MFASPRVRSRAPTAVGEIDVKKANRKGGNSIVFSGVLLVIWFSSSVVSTLVNKELMDHFPYAVTLSAVHMLSSAIVDFAIVYKRGLNLQFRKDVLIACLPVALAINFGKCLTYVSYGLVPASLTHTAKASSPVFSVIVSKILFNQVPTMATFLSLIPITVGVTLSALTEINWVFLGFIAAIAAALANVMNSTYTKKALHHANAADPLIFHMYTATVAVCMLVPYALVYEMPSITLFAPKTPSTMVASIAADAIELDHPPVVHLFPWRAMLLSLILHYAQNVSNIYYLNGVSVLTHQVAQSLKRLLNIAGAVLYFGNHVTFLNAAGMGLALLGFSMYSAAKQKPQVSSKSSPTPPMAFSPVHGGLTTHTPAAEVARAFAHVNSSGSGGGQALGPAAFMNSSLVRSESDENVGGSVVELQSRSPKRDPTPADDLTYVHPLHPQLHHTAHAIAQHHLHHGNLPATPKEDGDENFCV